MLLKPGTKYVKVATATYSGEGQMIDWIKITLVKLFKASQKKNSVDNLNLFFKNSEPLLALILNIVNWQAHAGFVDVLFEVTS